MNPTNIAATICPQCGHRLLPDAPEPGQCPECDCKSTGRAETRAARKPIADELLFRSQQRASWVVCFWVLLFVGPVYAAAFKLFKWDILASLPASLRPYAEISSNPVLDLCFCAAGAGFCLAKLWFPHERLRDTLAYTVLIGFVIAVVYGGFFFAAAIVLRLIARPNH